jgi:hypothetical protein
LTFILAIVFIGVLVSVVVFIVKSTIAELIEGRLKSRYSGCDIFVSRVDFSLIVLDFANKRVALGKGKLETVYSFDQIATVQVVESGNTLTQTNRGSQVLGTLVGGAALGGIGALLGGLTGSSISSTRLRHLSLDIIVDDDRNPRHSITFFKTSAKKGIDPNGLVARPLMKKIQTFHAQLLVAMRRAASLPPPLPPTQSSMLELDKLWELKIKGALSDEEFQQQKNRLLGSQSLAILKPSRPTIVPS